MADDTAMHVHVLRVCDHRISCADPVMVAGGFGHDAVALDLDAEWDGLSARLVLGPCESAYDVLYEGEPVVVPAATLAEAGWLPVSVVGHGGDGTVRVTTERCDHLLRVVESGCVDGSVPPEDQPDLLGQLVAAGQRATVAADAANDAAKAAQDAVAKVDEAVSDIGDAAANAAAARESAEAAAKSASAAGASENSARASAESASSDAGSASSSATAARQSATEAASSATGASQSATEAKASSDSASLSASSASADARTASQSASTAASAAGSASEAAAGAQSAARAAQAAAASAQEDASTAKAAADTATARAQAASASASAAAQSATDAKASADLAAGWVPADGEPGQILTKTEDGTAWRDAPSGNVLTGTATGYIAHAEDAYAQKPIEVRVKGKTVKNLWPVLSGSSNGITVSTDDTGLITVRGTSTAFARVSSRITIPVGTTVTISASRQLTDVTAVVFTGASTVVASISGNTTVKSGTVSGSSEVEVGVQLQAGVTVDLSFRVMLVEGTEAPDCFTPPASITSVQTGNLVTAGKNLLSDAILQQVAADQSDCIEYADGVMTVNANNGSAWNVVPTVMTVPPGDYVASFAGNNATVEVGNGTKNIASTYISNFVHFSLEVETTLSFKFISADAATFPVTITNIQLELGSTATAYEPPNVTQTPLPEVELRSLPNGTCDELVIGADGTCEVERNAAEYEVQGTETISVGEHSNGQKYATVAGIAFTSSSSSSMLSDRYLCGDYATIDNYAYIQDAITLVINDGRFTDVDTVKSILASEKPTFVFVVNQTTEPQSPVTLPVLPAPTFNVYHDSDVPSDTSVEYARDINIVLANLEAVQTALLGGE